MLDPSLAPFHLALRTDAGEVDALRRVLENLAGKVKSIELRADPGARGELVALLSCGDAAAARALTPLLKKLAEPLRIGVVELTRIDGEAAQRFAAVVDAMRVKVPSALSLEAAFNDLKRALRGPPLLKLSYDSETQLLEAWSRHVTEGGLWVKSARAPAGTSLRVQLQVGERELEPVHAVRLTNPPPKGATAGFWLALTPSGELSSIIGRAARGERQGRRSPVVPDTRRVHERFETALEVEFENFPDLESEFVSNISRGGLFVRTPAPPPMGARVTLTLALPGGERVKVDAEVVHRVTAEDAAKRGAAAGVGVEFRDLGPLTFEPIERLLAGFAQRRPRVLLIDGDVAWRARLASALTAAKLDVDLVADGHEGLVLLTEFFFEIDLVITDLGSPRLGGLELVERIRTQGGELGLNVMLLVDEPPGKGHQQGPTWMVSRNLPLEQLVKLVCAQVGVVRRD